MTDQEKALLRQTADRQEIAQVIYRLARAIDRCDKALLDACFHDDATDDHGIFQGSAREFSDWVMPQLQNYERTQHSIANILIDLDGDQAASESYFHAHHVIAGAAGAMNLVVAGRYLDRLERRDGVWRISARKAVYDWNRLDPSTDQWTNPALAGKLPRGQRGSGDLSYDVLRGE